MKILFTGDSITDVGRNCTNGSLISIGQGYPLIASAKLGAEYPQKFEFVNKGISGNRIVDIYSRIKADAWNDTPDIISMLIGVNDVWHDLSFNNGVEADRFEAVYRMFVSDTKKKFPDIKFIALEPFVLKGTATEESFDTFKSEVEKRAAIVKKASDDFGMVFVPLQEVFDKASEKVPASYWLGDGVHPTPAGHQLIADAWLDAFKKNFI